MEDNYKEAFGFAADVTKQLITLSTAIITITITFSKDIINFADTSAKNHLFWAWVLYILAVVFGIWTLMALTGSLQPIAGQTKKSETSDSSENPQTDKQECSINSKNIRIPSVLQILCFIAALSLTISYGYNSLDSKEKTKEIECVNSSKELKIIRETEYFIVPKFTTDTLIVK